MSTAPLSYDRAARQVEELMEHGMAFADVEDVINHGPVAEEEKAALWLFAWSLRDPAVQRRDARLMLGLGGRLRAT